MLEIPPYAPLVPPNLFGYDPSSYDAGEIPDFTLNDGKSLILWLSKTLEKGVSFIDPWGNEYVYEYPREDGEPGYRLFSMGPDGATGRGLMRMTWNSGRFRIPARPVRVPGSFVRASDPLFPKGERFPDCPDFP